MAQAQSSSTKNTALALASGIEIRNFIYTVREKQVMLDSDLARLYQVETKVFNRAAKRNQARFPDDFRFQLTSEERDYLRCQIGTLAGQSPDLSIGRTYLPYVYTEQGVAMLSGVLHSDIAIQTSVQIMRAFVEMRHFIASNAALFEQIRSVELRQLEYQKNTDERFERVFDYMNTHDAPKQKIFFKGQVFDAFELLVTLIQQAKREIVLIDGYVDVSTLNIFAKKKIGVAVSIWTNPNSKLTQTDIDTFNAQYTQLEVHHTAAFHDRFLILDSSLVYLIGASLKDAGKRTFAISALEDTNIIQELLKRLKP